MSRRARRKQKNKRGMLLITVFVLFILYAVGSKSIGLAAERNKKEAQIEAVERKIEEEEMKSEDFKQKKAYMQTRKYVEDAARKYLGLVYPDEVIIQPEE